MRSFALLPAALLAACASASGPLCPELPVGAPVDDFEYAVVERVVMEPPAPGEIPLSLGLHDAPPGFSSRRAFEVALRLGDPWAWRRFGDLVRRLGAASDMDDDAAATSLHRLLPFSATRESCAEAAAVALRARTLTTRRPLLWWMARCGASREVDALYAAPDVPTEVRLHRLRGRDRDDGHKAELYEQERWWLRSAATEVTRPGDLMTIGVALAQDGRSSSVALLLELAAAADPERRRWLFAGVDEAPNLCRSPELRARVEAFAIEHALDLEGLERHCALPPPETVVERFTKGLMPIAELRAYPRRAEVVTLLTRCSRETPRVHPGAVPCADALAWLDRPAGLRLAREELARAEVPANPPYQLSVQRRHALRRLVVYRDAETLDRGLREVGLIAPEDTGDLDWIDALPDRLPPPTAGVSPIPLLHAVGRLDEIDEWRRTREAPPHDMLLRVLARLAGPSLAEVVFEQTPDEVAAGGYAVHAYAAGERLTVVMQSRTVISAPSGPLVATAYDLSGVVGLLNTLLRERGDERRFVRLGESLKRSVLLGRPRSITRATACGLIRRAEGVTGDPEP